MDFAISTLTYLLGPERLRITLTLASLWPVNTIHGEYSLDHTHMHTLLQLVS